MGWDELTEAERSVTRLVCERLTNKQMADRLFVAPATVHWHLKNIFRKLEVGNRTQLALIAVADAARSENHQVGPGSELEP